MRTNVWKNACITLRPSANLHRENCTELANKLQQDFETYQRLSNVDEDDENDHKYDAWSQAESKARQTYDEARPVVQKKQCERENEERLQARKDQERQERKRRWEEKERRWEEEQWREAQAAERVQEEMCNAMERAEAEHWEKIAQEIRSVVSDEQGGNRGDPEERYSANNR